MESHDHRQIFDPAGVQIDGIKYFPVGSLPYTITAHACVWSDGDNYRVLVAWVGNGAQSAYFPPWNAGNVDYSLSYVHRFGKVDVAGFLGSRVGVGGDDDGACLVFDDYYISRPSTPCVECMKECTYIKWDEKPKYLAITFTGWQNGTCARAATSLRAAVARTGHYHVKDGDGCSWFAGITRHDRLLFRIRYHERVLSPRRHRR